MSSIDWPKTAFWLGYLVLGGFVYGLLPDSKDDEGEGCGFVVTLAFWPLIGATVLGYAVAQRLKR